MHVCICVCRSVCECVCVPVQRAQKEKGLASLYTLNVALVQKQKNLKIGTKIRGKCSGGCPMITMRFSPTCIVQILFDLWG